MGGVAAPVTHRNIANRVVVAVSGSYARLQFITVRPLVMPRIGTDAFEDV